MNNNLLKNTKKNNSIFHYSIINKNKIITDNSNSINLKQINSSQTLINKLKLSPLFKNNNKHFFKNQNNYPSCDSTIFNFNSNSNKNKIKKIIKFKSENNNKRKYKNYILDNNDNLLTDNIFFNSFSFNEQLNKYLKNNNSNYYNKKSLLAFKEKNDIYKKMCFINNFCKKLIKNYKKNNYYENILNNIHKASSLYEKYKNEINNYLLYIEQQKIKEEKILEKIIKKKLNLKIIINNLYNQIAKNKFIINECKEIKEFLLKVKYKVSDIEDIPKNILTLYEKKNFEYKNDNNLIKGNDINIRQNTFNLVTDFHSFKKIYKLPKIIKDNPNEHSINNLNIKQVNEDLYLTNIKNENEIKNFNKRLSYRKRRSFITNSNKQCISGKNPIFEEPEDFMNTYNGLINKMKKSLEYYNEIIYQIQNLKNDKINEKNYLVNEKLEKKCKILLYNLKQENIKLNKKLKLYVKLNNLSGFEEQISIKIKNILLEINSITNIEKTFNIIQYESKLEKYETNNLQTKEEKNKAKIVFLMGILEKIFDYLMNDDKFYKNNPLYKGQYKKIKTNEENAKLIKIRHNQINKLKKKEQEKNKRIIENYTRIRFLSLNKKGMTFYNNNKKELIKNSNISSLNETSLLNPIFTFSFDTENNNDKIIKKKMLSLKNNKKYNEKRKEMINILLY